MAINQSINEMQKAFIISVQFDGLLEIKCDVVPERLTAWLINHFDTERSKLVFPHRGTIPVDDVAVRSVFRIPMGDKHIDYEKKGYSDMFAEFYKLVGHEHDQKAPTFIEAEKWFKG